MVRVFGMLHMIRCFSHVVAIVIAILLPGPISTAGHAQTIPENALLAAARSTSDNDDLMGVQAIESKALDAGSDANRQGDRRYFT